MIRPTLSPHDMRRRLETMASAFDPLPNVLFAYLFGSFARDRAGPLSDVDIAVYLEDDVDPGEQRLQIVGSLTRHLETDAVDVVVLNTAPIALAGRVLSDRRVIVDRRPQLRHRYESVTIRQFLDFRQFERRLLERRFAGGGQGPAAPQAG